MDEPTIHKFEFKSTSIISHHQRNISLNIKWIQRVLLWNGWDMNITQSSSQLQVYKML